MFGYLVKIKGETKSFKIQTNLEDIYTPNAHA